MRQEGGAVGDVPNGHATERALNERLRALDPTIRRWAARACRDHADQRMVHVDDVANVMRLACADVLQSALAGEASASPDPSTALLARVSHRAADRYFHSSARTGFTGATGAARRASRARMTAAALGAMLGRTPSEREVIEAVNAHALASRRDPAKQGALIRDVTDLLVEPETLDDRVGSRRRLDDDVHRRVAAELAVRRTIEICAAMRPELGEIAAAWLGGSLAEPPIIPTVAELAELSSRQRDEVRALLDECRVVAELVCLELGLGVD